MPALNDATNRGKRSSRSTVGKRNSDASARETTRRASGGRGSNGNGASTASFSSVPDVSKDTGFTGVSNSPPGLEPTPQTRGPVGRKLSSGSSAGSTDGRADGVSTSSLRSGSSGTTEATRRSSRERKATNKFGEFQSWESVAADEVPPSPAFVGNPRQRQAYLEAYAKNIYEQEVAERKAKGDVVDDTVDDVRSRVEQLMNAANEMLPDYAPSPAKSLHAKSLQEQLRESWKGRDYYSKLMAQMASPSPARPSMRPPHMQRLHQGTNGAAAAANRAKQAEAQKQQAALANMSGNALNGFGGGGGGYMFANLVKRPEPAPVPVPVAPAAQAKAATKTKRKSGDIMPPPGPKRGSDKSPESAKSESSVEMEIVANSVKKIEQAMRRISMSPAPTRLAFTTHASTDSNSPGMSGMQLKFDSPSDSSVDVDAVLVGDDMEAMRKAIRDLRRENEELRSKLVETQRDARSAGARVSGSVIAQAKMTEHEFSRKF
ncbi:unnamed product [Ostreococcus tauri]|uniref:Unnamed product n=1 Tax=Ostreococcus tauri TaxID=70448 RepID=A0A090M9Y1_OSTTA|nr:unnamed product [Ostreococcus tauri]CEF99537.1 unnamed product [Ostreococcus tauri]|eukprot:XP_022839891.1 unnamed product [Ostreococcus tauri]